MKIINFQPENPLKTYTYTLKKTCEIQIQSIKTETK